MAKNNAKDKKTKKEHQSLHSVFSNVHYILREVWRGAPSYIIVTIIECIVWGLFDTVRVWYIKDIFDRLERGESFASTLIPLIVFIASIPVYFLLYYWFWQVHTPTQRIKLSMRMHTHLFERARAMNIEAYDDPAFYDDYIWTMRDCDERFANFVSDLGQLGARLISATGLVAIMLSIDPVLAAVSGAVSITRVLIWRGYMKIGLKHEVEGTKLWRKSDYIDRVFRLEEYAKEIRFGKISDVLMEEFDKTTEARVRVDTRFGGKYFLLCISGNILSTGYRLFCYVYLLYGIVVTKVITLGGFAAALNSTWQLGMYFDQIIESVMNIPKHSLYVDKVRRFLEEGGERREAAAVRGEFRSLELKNVTFSYKKRSGDDAESGSRAPALKDVSLEIRAGEKCALVGYNGAGKTTLVKLMLGMYEPDSGEILLNGVPIGEYDPADVRRAVGAVFQDLRIFAATLGENVEMGAVAPERRSAIEAALRLADFGDKLDSYENGLDTMLTREFDENGVNLSGGESQKVAISRVFAKDDNDFVVMDEPSSALDPVAESRLNEAVSEYSVGRTVIFISHRLSSVKDCDKIFMFDSGVLCEVGSHDELMSLGGKYANMFHIQAKKYEEAE